MIKIYLKRQFIALKFWGIILVLIAISIFSKGFGLLSGNNFVTDSIFEEIVNYDTINYMDYIIIYNSYNVLNYIISNSYFYLALPMLCIPFIINYCDDINNNFEKMIISRIGHSKFHRNAIFSLIIISLLSSFLAVGIMSVISYLTFPSANFNIIDYFMLVIRKWLLSATLLTIYSLIMLIVVTITKNKFLSIVSSILIIETCEVTMTRTSMENFIFKKPRTFLNLYFLPHQNENILYIICHLVFIILLLFISYFLLEKRHKNNE